LLEGLLLNQVKIRGKGREIRVDLVKIDPIQIRLKVLGFEYDFFDLNLKYTEL